jgi:hypothetical protein
MCGFGSGARREGSRRRGRRRPEHTGRESGLDDVHTEAFELTRQPDLLVEPHGEAGRLLTVAERRVENDESIRHGNASVRPGGGQSQDYDA